MNLQINKYKSQGESYMKSFSGLQHHYSISQLKKPTATPALSSYQINKNSSVKNISKQGLVKKKEPFRPKIFTNFKQRISKSIQEFPHLQSSSKSPSFRVANKTANKQQDAHQLLIQNCEQNDNEAFGKSYQKLSRVYNNFEKLKKNSAIEQELSQILQLIKQERAAIKQKMAQVEEKKQAKLIGSVSQKQQNTDPIVIKEEIKNEEKEVQTYEPEEKLEPASNNTYCKLIKILEDMNIDSKQILPKQIQIEEGSKNEGRTYKELKESQIILVQKFVIKKLFQRICSLEQNLS